MGGRVKAICLLLAFVSVSVNANEVGSLTSHSASQHLSYLNVASPERDTLILKENMRVNDVLAKSPNHRPILRYLSDLVNTKAQHVMAVLGPRTFLVRERAGFKGDRLLVIDNGNIDVVLDLQDRTYKNSARIFQVQPSPDRKTVVVMISVNGAITNFDILVVDLPSHEIKAQFAGMGSALYWVSESKFLAARSIIASVPNQEMMVYDIFTQESSYLSFENLAEFIAQSKSSASTPQAQPDDVVTNLAFVPTTHGLKVPTVFIHQANVTPDGNRPVLLKSYGGFGVNTFNDLTVDPMETQFILDGGVIVYAGLRGGSELGAAWAALGRGAKNKINTYQDLASVAQFIVSQGWTTSEKLVSMGGSNGGLTVAATALLFPNTFGLVIPVSGVLDLVDFDDLDRPYALPWRADYGDPTSVDDLVEILKISPVELAERQGRTKFLIISGLQDDRVNVAHSIKFFQALKEKGGSPDNVHLVLTQGTGHSALTFSGGRAEWLTMNRYWTMIYDHFGMSFSPK